MSAATGSAPVAPAGEVRPAPGEIGMWILVAAELATFTILFGGFVATWGSAREAFADADRASLVLGVVNTVLLVTSSAFVATAVHALRVGRIGDARRHLATGAALGVGFAAVKAVEYGLDIADGLTPTTNPYWMHYFVITGLHLVHVLVGVALLVLAGRLLGGPARTVPSTGRHVESVATYWHMVDVLWIMIFSLVYLAAR